MSYVLSNLPIDISLLDSEQIQSLRDALAGEEDLARDLVDTFQAECSPALERFSKACEGQEAKEVQQLSHFMAGSAANLGLLRFSKICRRIEEGIIDGHEPDYATLPPLLYKQFEDSVTAVRLEFGLN